MAQDVEPFGICSHERVLNAVMNHLDKVASTNRAAVQISDIAGVSSAATPGSHWNGSSTRRKRAEHGVKARNSSIWPADHQAVAALQTPHTTRNAAVHVIDALGGQCLGSSQVVAVVTVSAVNDGVTG